VSATITPQLPYSQACENNKHAILKILKSAFAPSKRVLEIGSGTGQHAVHFARHLPHLVWHTSDMGVDNNGMHMRIVDSGLANIAQPVVFDVYRDPWPQPNIDAVFSANTAHIMPWTTTLHMLNSVAEVLPMDGVFALYGPFNYGGNYSSASNAEFDSWLQSRDASQGIRDFEAVTAALETRGMLLVRDHAMPANNRLLIWKKTGIYPT